MNQRPQVGRDLNQDLAKLAKKEEAKQKKLVLKLQKEAKKNAQQPNSTEIKNEAQLEQISEKPEDEQNVLQEPDVDMVSRLSAVGKGRKRKFDEFSEGQSEVAVGRAVTRKRLNNSA